MCCTDYPFKLEETNIVAMSVKPADFTEDEAEVKGVGKSGIARARGDGEDRGAGCRCVVL